MMSDELFKTLCVRRGSLCPSFVSRSKVRVKLYMLF